MKKSVCGLVNMPSSYVIFLISAYNTAVPVVLIEHVQVLEPSVC